MSISSPNIPLLSAGWTADQLPNFHSTFIPKLSQQSNKVFQDLSETILAQNNNDPLSVLRCPYSNFRYALRSGSTPPSLKTDGAGRWWAENDGTLRLIDGPSTFNVAPYTIFIRYKKIVAGTNRCLSGVTANWLLGPWGIRATDMYDGSFHSSNTHDNDLNDWTMTLVRDTSTVRIYANGIDLTASTTPGVNPDQLLLLGWISNSEYFNGRIYGLILCNSAVSNTDRVNGENFINAF